MTAQVPAGRFGLQALDRHADVETLYGGRFVQAVNGIKGSLDDQRDWFYFVNGIEPGVGAAEVELNEGDVAWWDYRDWSRRMAAPVVVGAFPEPFLHGWDGERRPAESTRRASTPRRTRCYVCSAAPAARGSRMSSGSWSSLMPWARRSQRGAGRGRLAGTFTLAGSEPRCEPPLRRSPKTRQ